VDTGDDTLCVKSGEDWVGRHDAVRAENIIFRNIEVGTGHGITSGSDMAAGVRNVSVSSQPRRVFVLSRRFSGRIARPRDAAQIYLYRYKNRQMLGSRLSMQAAAAA
jgi:hypothetical protein